MTATRIMVTRTVPKADECNRRVSREAKLIAVAEPVAAILVRDAFSGSANQ